MQLKDKRFEIFIANSQIEKRIKQMADQISAEYKDQVPVLLPVLNGAFMFSSDLIKELSIPCEVTFIKTKSYSGTQSTGMLKQCFGIDLPLKDRHVLIIDDIVDTGLTMHTIIEEIREEKPASIAIISLLLKPEALQKQLEIKYVGFTIPNNFVVGYGLDYEGLGRNLKDIYQLKN